MENSIQLLLIPILRQNGLYNNTRYRIKPIPQDITNERTGEKFGDENKDLKEGVKRVKERQKVKGDIDIYKTEGLHILYKRNLKSPIILHVGLHYPKRRAKSV